MDIKGLFYSSIHFGVQLLYPPRCLLCGGIGFDGMDLCEHCYQLLPFNRTACINCALPLPPDASEGAVCGRCQKKAPYYNQSFSVFSYQQPMIWLIQQLKFNDRLVHARLLAELLNMECEKN